jgi:hypothetical protein
MPFRTTTTDREFDKFVATPDGETAVRIQQDSDLQQLSGTGTGNLVAFTDTPTQPVGFFGPLADRKGIFIQPLLAGVYLGFDSSVSHVTGIKLFKDQLIYLNASEAAGVYLVTFTGQTIQVRVWEVK